MAAVALIAAGAATACTLFAWRESRRLSCLGHPREFAERVRFAMRSRDGVFDEEGADPAPRWVYDALQQKRRHLAIRIMNGELSGLDRELTRARTVPAALGRISIGIGTAGAAATLADSIGEGTNEWSGTLTSFGAGLAAALIIAAIGRRARRRARQLAGDYDRLVSLVLSHVPE